MLKKISGSLTRRPKTTPQPSPTVFTVTLSRIRDNTKMRQRCLSVARSPVFNWVLLTLLITSLCASVQAGFKADKLAAMDAAITNAIAEKRLPGAVIWLEHNGQIYQKAYGNKALVPKVEEMTEDTIFDVASLTKVMATAPSIMLLIESGKVKLDEPVHTYLPEFTGNGRDKVTIRHLMTHVSGLAGGGQRMLPSGYNAELQALYQQRSQVNPGQVFRYTDENYILLGELIQRVTGTTLDRFAEREIFTPLKMTNTCFLPSISKVRRIAPTQMMNNGVIRGTVHDPKARAMGGVAGHAGVFSTVADMARLCRMMLNNGELDGVRVLKAETVKLMTSIQSPDTVPERRGLGWDIESGYSRRGRVFPVGSYGHTGFTGTSVWIDPFSKTFLIIFSNRVHPDSTGNIGPLQMTLATLAAEAIDDFNFSNVPGALTPRYTNNVLIPEARGFAPARGERDRVEVGPVLNGIDVLAKQNFEPVKKLRLGLITNHTGQDREQRSTIDLLKNAPDVMLKKLFSPEHGIRGAQDEKVGDSVDEKTGLPVYSLYGAGHYAPTPEQLQDLDAVVFDIQDIGCRYYTYISTLGYCLEAADTAKLKFIVLDRVNPINGVTVEGPVFQGSPTFTAFHPLPLRHGMTVGELAKMYVAERGFKTALTVIPVEGWKRAMWFDETGLPYVNPSPNMRTQLAAQLYPGLGLHETALSVGRGTDTPFEICGAPYIDADKLAAEMNGASLAGVRFTPVHFKPTASTFKDQECNGVRLTIPSRDQVQAVDVGITLALALERLYPTNFTLTKLNTLLCNEATLEAIRAGKSLAEIKQGWAADLERFKTRREAFLLYQ
jgi:uncharacterized protein YbbC (DUF1343 family)/CubicO group peptidase (beta-lactamase class C family)